jgi:hypothetical protein
MKAEPRDEGRPSDEDVKLRGDVDTPRVAKETKKRAGRVRRVVAGILVVLTSLCVVATTVGLWTRWTLSTTDRYVALVGPLAADPAVTNALAERLTEEIFEGLDVEARVQEALASIPELPPSAAFLAGPIASGARDLIEGEARDFLGSERFATLWSGINRRAHSKVVALLRGEYEELPNVSINGGEVRLNLVSAIAEVVRRLTQQVVNPLGIDATIPTIPPTMDVSPAIERFGSAIGVALPEDFGQVTIMTADQLSGYQDTVRTMSRLLGLLVLLSLLLVVLTVIVASDRRRVVIWLGVGITGTILLAGVFLRRVEGRILDQVSRPGARAAAQDVFDQVSDSLRGAAVPVLAVAILAALVAYLLGRPPWLRRATEWGRRVTASRPQRSELEVWIADHGDPVRIGVIGGAVVILFLTGIDWIPVVIVGLLLGILLWGVASAERRVQDTAPPRTSHP